VGPRAGLNSEYLSKSRDVKVWSFNYKSVNISRFTVYPKRMSWVLRPLKSWFVYRDSRQ